MFLNSVMAQKALSNSLVGTGLKSIGSFARLTDIPAEHQNLRERTLKRELAVLGMTFIGGLLMEAAFSLIPPKYRQNPLVEFVPQAIAIYASEVLSRKMTNYSEALRESLEPQSFQQPRAFGPDRFTPRLDAVEFKQRPVLGEVAFASRPQPQINRTAVMQMKGFM